MGDVQDREDVWVIDTSSILEVRRRIEVAKQPDVYRKLGEFVERDRLYFPRAVLEELERQTANIAKSGRRDLPYEWAKQHAEVATRHGTDHVALRHVLAVDGVADLLDPDKKGVEVADPYVLALAHHLNAHGRFARVITEDRKNAGDKLSLAAACGLVGIPVVPMIPFVASRGIWRPV